MKKTRIHNILFILLVLILALPVLQQAIGFPKVAGLKGYFVKAKKPVLNSKGLWTGTYQDSLNKFVEDNIGFRPDLVRINNTADYYLYNRINANNVILGKQNFAYEEGYILATLGRDFMGHEKIKEKAEKAAFLHEYYKSKGTDLIFLFAPGKATFFPEYIPEEYNPDSITTTNHETYTAEFNNHDLSIIDYNSWFIAMKDTSRYPLYPQYGIHWSRYGMTLAFDSLVHYIENTTQKDMVELSWDHIDISGKLRGTDYDLGKALNLLWQLPTTDMAYPHLVWEKKEGKYMPDVVCISDSYFWNWYGTGMTNKVFNKTDFLYYFNQYYSSEWSGSKKVDDLDIIPFLESHDLILVMSTDGNLHKFAFDFIDRMYALLSGNATNPVNFTFIHEDYTNYNNETGEFIIRKGTPQFKSFLRATDLNLQPNTTYRINYEAKGFNILEMDIHNLEDIPVYANTEIQEYQWNSFSWTFTTGDNVKNPTLRLYMDFVKELTIPLYLRNITITEFNENDGSVS
ncbi:MAG: hypothetical protein RBR21_11070 [Bacteroidales bacterium]|nr:hypothetical protein [Bacteroidales bacterium]